MFTWARYEFKPECVCVCVCFSCRDLNGVMVPVVWASNCGALCGWCGEVDYIYTKCSRGAPGGTERNRWAGARTWQHDTHRVKNICKFEQYFNRSGSVAGRREGEALGCAESAKIITRFDHQICMCRCSTLRMVRIGWPAGFSGGICAGCECARFGCVESMCISPGDRQGHHT